MILYWTRTLNRRGKGALFYWVAAATAWFLARLHPGGRGHAAHLGIDRYTCFFFLQTTPRNFRPFHVALLARGRGAPAAAASLRYTARTPGAGSGPPRRPGGVVAPSTSSSSTAAPRTRAAGRRARPPSPATQSPKLPPAPGHPDAPPGPPVSCEFLHAQCTGVGR